MSAPEGVVGLDDPRSKIEELTCGMPGGVGDHGYFNEPWELRAFALAVTACLEGHYQWSQFQRSLIESIRRWEDGNREAPWSYYEHWLNALETVLADVGALSDSQILDERTRDVLATPRNTNHHHANREPVAISPASI
jgi:nitrile hydratase accessory protein